MSIADGLLKDIEKRKAKRSKDHVHTMRIEKHDGGFTVHHNGNSSVHKTMASVKKHMEANMCNDEDCQGQGNGMESY
jgi:hypothetical protein